MVFTNQHLLLQEEEKYQFMKFPVTASWARRCVVNVLYYCAHTGTKPLKCLLCPMDQE